MASTNTFSVPSIIPLKIYITNQVQYTYKYVAFSLPHYDLCKQIHGVYRGNYIDGTLISAQATWNHLILTLVYYSTNVSTICTKITIIYICNMLHAGNNGRKFCIGFIICSWCLHGLWAQTKAWLGIDLIEAERKSMYHKFLYTPLNHFSALKDIDPMHPYHTGF